MLVLSRLTDESIMIGDDIEVVIVRNVNGKVKLGINAPQHIQVHRKEVYEAIQREKRNNPAGTGKSTRTDGPTAE